MERVGKILNHDLFMQYLRMNEEAERDRTFCRHDMGHFMDVARIAWILNLEENLSIDRETVYVAALLHDIGRHVQYADGTPHEKASARLAAPILKDCGFDDKETSVIISAIETHRDSSIALQRNLNGILYRADKASRACFACKAEKECNWKENRKNKSILW